MLRWIHKVLALAVLLPVIVLVLSGSVLSVIPASERAGAISPGRTSVADLAGRVANSSPGVEQIKRLPSGKVIAFYAGADGPAASVVDPSSGKPASDYVRSPFERWMTNLHRSFFLDDGGRVAAGASALAMLVLTVSGLQMTARRMGGWRHVLGYSRGGGVSRLHADLGRLAAFGLVLSTVTALYLSLATFGLIPDGTPQAPAFPNVTSGGPHIPIEQMTALRAIDLAELRELTFPNRANPDDLFHLTTAVGEGYVDPASGEMLAWQAHTAAQRIYEFIYMLHTGQGLWWLGLLLGISALSVPVLSASGAVMWWSRRRTHARIADDVLAKNADTVILVGSEGGSTWGFARTLHAALTANGHRVHAAPMNSLLPSYPSARRMFLLTATYGDGSAPATASVFLKRLDAISELPSFPVAVLGFGDRQFPQYCQFASDVEGALARKGWTSLMPLETIDRQSGQEFARWGEALSGVMGEKLVLAHVPERSHTHTLTLIDRVDYGAEVQAPTCVLRFALPKSGMFARLAGKGWPRFAAGDLIAILPPDGTLPRYYSLASSARDGFVEICVRKHPGGLCSGLLHGLQPGDKVEAFVKANPAFHPAHGRKPVILIGAGTGIGPLAGFVRANDARRPMHLYFGGRDPASDFLYQDEIDGWLGEERLTSLTTTFSRVKGGGYVQDRLRDDADRLRTLIAGGAQVMVCGGRGMAAGVMQAMADVLAPIGLAPVALKAQGRYVEDVY
ncbi:PepSY domain-containing protein [Bradyrhizobium sp. HKCCYLS2038]|uniref:PepSY domain-containing protein n=1 Tax=unclassified Bradyrhizobium TaxID=2631580 RepID=UPI003EBE7CF6